MTWDEFKAWAEANGLKGEDTIWCIDWSFEPQRVTFSETEGWTIS